MWTTEATIRYLLYVFERVLRFHLDPDPLINQACVIMDFTARQLVYRRYRYLFC